MVGSWCVERWGPAKKVGWLLDGILGGRSVQLVPVVERLVLKEVGLISLRRIISGSSKSKKRPSGPLNSQCPTYRFCDQYSKHLVTFVTKFGILSNTNLDGHQRTIDGLVVLTDLSSCKNTIPSSPLRSERSFCEVSGNPGLGKPRFVDAVDRVGRSPLSIATPRRSRPCGCSWARRRAGMVPSLPGQVGSKQGASGASRAPLPWTCVWVR